MYRALYRKWRPQRFEDVVGQRAIVTALKNQITANRVGHAYLFTGVRGTGKTTCAKIFAKAVNCLHPVNGDPCGECEICKGIDNGSILDVVEMDAASNNGVDDIRDLRDETAYTPSACKYKVYIIDEVHMLSTAAFNALLKTLEEPPAHVIFILATTEIQKVPATILSRCQRYDFTRIGPEDIARRVEYIAGEEKLELSPDGAELIARLADGALRDALSILDTCAGVTSKIDADVVRRMASFYNKLAVGALEIRKSTNTGNHLDGWKFIVKKDGEEIPGSPFTTDETGIIRISNLAPGKYVILESPTDDSYWTMELGYHTVTVEYGKTAVDQWLNKEQGLGCFTKSTNAGDEISGWHITVYADEACTQELHTLITGQDGTVCIYLEPGTYWVKETGSEDVRDDYWKMDDSVKQLVIRAHEKTILEFVNNYSGRISIRKSVEPEGTLEGWKFKITDADGKEVSGSPFTTDKDGKILTGNLTPGEYTVEEVLPADSLYTGEAPKTVTVVAGKTAEVSFLNKLRAGKITIRKVDTNDVPLSGATFLLEGSEDGSLWYPVIPGPNGVCVLDERSEENLAAASKTSGEDGLLTWENLSITLQYRITETKAPEGYTLLKEAAFEGTLPADTLELRVVNGEAFTLPKTGSVGFVRIPMATVFCLMLCAANLWLLRKKEQ